MAHSEHSFNRLSAWDTTDRRLHSDEFVLAGEMRLQHCFRQSDELLLPMLVVDIVRTYKRTLNVDS